MKRTKIAEPKPRRRDDSPARKSVARPQSVEAKPILIIRTAGLKEKQNGKRRPSTLAMTVGHSTRTIEEFVGLLQAHAVTGVVDVRTVPRSRHNPQFNRDTLPASLKRAGLGYVHMPGLGGLRHAKPDSMNVGWRNASFRGYADYMQTPEFEQSLEDLIQLVRQDRIAIMCAEAVPWRCHRSLIGDALLAHGIRVEDIMSPGRRQVHALTTFAKVCGRRVVYPAEVPQPSKQKVSLRRGRLPLKGK